MEKNDRYCSNTKQPSTPASGSEQFQPVGSARVGNGWVIFRKTAHFWVRDVSSVPSILFSQQLLQLGTIFINTHDRSIRSFFSSTVPYRTACFSVSTSPWHYNDVIMSAMTYEITGVSIVCLTVCSSADQRKYQSCASLAFVRGIHWWPVDSLTKGQ